MNAAGVYLLNAQTEHLFIGPTVEIDGEIKSKGLVKRDYSTHPEGCAEVRAFAEPFPDSLLIDEDEIDGRLADLRATQSCLLSLREGYYQILKSLDQNGYGLCWMFSSTKGAMYTRVKQGNLLPGILSAWYGAGLIKNWRDQGGNGIDSIQFIATHGLPALSFCPAYKSSSVAPDAAINAELHKFESWWEGSSDPEKAFHQLASANCLGLGGVVDLDWMGHSMWCPGVYTYKNPQSDFDNSWGEAAGNRGLYRAQGQHCFPNGLWIPRTQTPSEN